MKNSIKFIHVSDIHIGVETHGKINSATGRNTRLEDILSSLDYVLNTAIKESVDLVLVAGDVFHRENPHPTEETEFAKRIQRLAAEAKAKVIIALGNHDYPSAFGRAAAVEIFPALNLDGVTIARRADVYSVTTKNGIIQVACLPWARTGVLLTKEEYKSFSAEALQVEMEKRLITIIRDLTKRIDKSAPAVFLGHLAIRDAQISGTERMTSLFTYEPSIPRGELANSIFSYVALGHIHRFQNLNKGSNPPIVYSGSIERIDFTEEKEQKGFVLGEIFKGSSDWECNFEFVETPARRFLTIEVDGKDGEDAILNRISTENVKGLVVRLRYKASNPSGEINEKKIREALSEAYSVKVERIFGKPEKAVRQTEISKTTNVMDALEKYIQSKPELKNMAEDMLKYAKELIEK
ncbi:MAG TPA: exonuclease SbcCD subunit D [Thermodesulfobacteriota bacterium]|nr:exonuclease SbcCD subunit D [Thermodesulfobacteriota bacterium]